MARGLIKWDMGLGDRKAGIEMSRANALSIVNGARQMRRLDVVSYAGKWVGGHEVTLEMIEC